MRERRRPARDRIGVLRTDVEPDAGRSGRRHRRGRRGFWVLPVAVTAGILVLSLGPDVVKNRVPDPFKPLPHIVAYLMLAVVTFTARGWRQGGNRVAYWASVLGLGLAMIALGAALEGGQALVHRDTQVSDIEADAVGIAFGLGLWLFIGGVRETATRRRLRRSRPLVEPPLGVRGP
jgi:VanZ family protein